MIRRFEDRRRDNSFMLVRAASKQALREAERVVSKFESSGGRLTYIHCSPATREKTARKPIEEDRIEGPVFISGIGSPSVLFSFSRSEPSSAADAAAAPLLN